MLKQTIPENFAGGDGERCFPDFPLAMAYVVMQRFTNLALPEQGLRQGTVFSDLVKPLECGLRRRPMR